MCDAVLPPQQLPGGADHGDIAGSRDSGITTVSTTASSTSSIWAPGVAWCAAQLTPCARCQPLPPCAAHACVTVTYLTAALRREGNILTAFTLPDGGSGNEVVTGSFRYGEFACLTPSLPWASCRSKVVVMPCSH